jgi:hypothetical protein
VLCRLAPAAAGSRRSLRGVSRPDGSRLILAPLPWALPLLLVVVVMTTRLLYMLLLA